MKKLQITLLSLCLLAAGTMSCGNSEYDLNKGVDETIAIGGDSLSFPLFNNLKIKLNDLINPDSSKNIHVYEDGYHFCLDDSCNFEIPKVAAPSIADQTFSVKPFVFKFSSAVSAPSTEGLQAAAENIVTLKHQDTVSLEVPIDFPAEVKAVKLLGLDGTKFNIELSISGMPTFTKPVTLDVKLVLPDIVEASELEGGHEWSFRQTIEAGASSFTKTLGIDAMSLAGYNVQTPHFKLQEKAYLDIQLTADITSISGIGHLTDEILIAPKLVLKDINCKEITGTIDLSFDAFSESFIFGEELPGIFQKGSTLDLDPIITVVIEHNLDIPVGVAVNVAAKNQGKTSFACPFSLQTTTAADPEEPLSEYFWVAADNEGMPSEFTFVEAPLGKLIEDIPDQLDFTMKGSTLTDNGWHHYIFGAPYKATADFLVDIPLAFGINTDIIYKNYVADVDMSGFSSYVKDYMEIYGTTSNSIPLDVVITLTPVDKDKKAIEGIAPVVITVKACGTDGSPRETKFSTRLSTGDGKIDQATGLQLTARIASTVPTSGQPLYPEDALDITMKVRLPGGLQIPGEE